MKVAFHSNQLGIRGTEVAMFDYAWHNRDCLGHESFIISDNGADLETLPRFQAHFPVFLYREFSEVQQFASDHAIDVVYFIKAGTNDGKIVPGVRNVVHAVFPCFEPHGAVYAYISEWLSKAVSKGRYPFVPFMVTLPDCTDNLREELSIAGDATVFGRHGGFDQFDIPFVQRVVFSVAQSRPDIVFLFMNTKPFCAALPNIVHVERSPDLLRKCAFINSCDAMLHARAEGESFGLAIAEFLHQGKPVITQPRGRDLNHVEMLGADGLYYRTAHELYELLMGFEKSTDAKKYQQLVAPFDPGIVMQKFAEVFLQ